MSKKAATDPSPQADVFTVLPLVLPRLFFGDRVALRLTCREGRVLYDKCQDSLKLDESKRLFGGKDLDFELPPSEVIGARVGQILRHGCRPERTSIVLTWTADVQEAERKVLAFLSALAVANSVSSVCLRGCTPLTPAIASALAGAGYKITDLGLSHGLGEYTSVPPPPGPSDVEVAAAGGEQLLRLIGPNLESLSIYPDQKGRYLPAQALNGLSFCTALQKLSLGVPSWPESDVAGGVAGELSLFKNLAALSRLRSLCLGGGAYWQPPMAQRLSLACALEACLAQLTALTSLQIDLLRLRHFPDKQDLAFYGEEPGPSLSEQLRALQQQGQLQEVVQLRSAAASEWRCVASAARRMPSLVELRVPLQADVADLASLKALTCLRVGALALPEVRPLDVWAFADDGSAVYALPPSLERLETHAPNPVRVIAALRPSVRKGDPCTLISGGRLWLTPSTPWVLEFGEGDVDGEGRLREDAAAAMRRAAGVLQRLGFREEDEFKDDGPPGLCIRARGRDGSPVRPPAPAGGAAGPENPVDGVGSHVESWLGELSRFKLNHLALLGFTLPPGDMLGLARCMPELQELDIHGCAYALHSLPLLAGMRQLRELYLNFRGWGWQARLPDAIECAFLALVAAGTPGQPANPVAEGAEAGAGQVGPLPLLQVLQVTCPDGEVELLERALAPARGELARRGTGAEIVLAEE